MFSWVHLLYCAIFVHDCFPVCYILCPGSMYIYIYIVIYPYFPFTSLPLASGTDETGHTASDSGCDLQNGSPGNIATSDQSTYSLVLPPGEQVRNEAPSPGDQKGNDIDHSGRQSGNTRPNIEIERLQLPHSSDSDSDGPHCENKGSPRTIKAWELNICSIITATQ